MNRTPSAWHKVALALALSLCLCLGASSEASAQPATANIPAPLAPWVPWVLDQNPTYGCTWTWVGGAQEQQCSFPSSVRLTLTPGGLSFEMRVSADRDTHAELPGGGVFWPLDVTVDGQASGTLAVSEIPLIRLSAGSHVVSGRFTWRSAPETFSIPTNVAVVELRRGDSLQYPRRDDTGKVWLNAGERTAQQEDRVTIEVFRKLRDSVPLELSTRLVLEVSGKPRELDLGNILPQGFRPAALSSDLPFELRSQRDSIDRLVLHVAPGVHSVTFDANRPSPEGNIVLNRGTPHPMMPERETWVWQADETLRQVEISGGTPIDVNMTNLPMEWRAFPAYTVDANGATIALATKRRGNANPGVNEINVQRELWLDFDGVGLTGRDRITGQMHQDWRLAFSNGELGRVALTADVEVGTRDQLVIDTGNGPGVEIRRGVLDVTGEWRNATARNQFLASGWKTDVSSLSATLNLPPGYRAFTVRNVDTVEGTFLDKWKNLWALFFVLVVSVAFARLLGAKWILVALPLMVLTYHETDISAPRWSWVPVLLLLALVTTVRADPQGRFAQLLRFGFLVSLLVLVVIATPFATYTLRDGFFPQQIATPDYSGFEDSSGVATTIAAAPEPGRDNNLVGNAIDSLGGSLDRGGTSTRSSAAQLQEGAGGSRHQQMAQTWGSSQKRNQNLYANDANVVLQTGPGIPKWSSSDWNWRRVQLRWSGPVTASTAVTAILMPPWLNALLSLARVVLLGALLWAMWRKFCEVAPSKISPPSKGDPTGPENATATGGAVAVAAALALMLLVPSAVNAQQPTGLAPSPEVLAELTARLTRPPACAPSCATISDLAIAVSDGTNVALTMRVHVAARTAVPLPGPIATWAPQSVSSGSVARLSDGYAYVRLEPGEHTITVRGRAPESGVINLSFALKPRHVSVSAPQFEVDGVDENGIPTDSIELRRARTVAPESPVNTDPSAARVTGIETSWLTLERRFDIGIRWEMTSRLRRLTDGNVAAVERIPLLPGESVTSANVTIEGSHVVATIGRGETEVEWTSVLVPSESLALSPRAGLTETYTVTCGAIWRCEFDGLAPTSDRNGEHWEPAFRPFPGDRLSLKFSRPQGVKGQSTTVDGMKWKVRPGSRLSANELVVLYRASNGTTERIELPAKSIVRALLVDGSPRPVQYADAAKRILEVNVQPGAHNVTVRFDTEASWRTFFSPTAPRLVNRTGVNGETLVHLDPSRWFLWLAGPLGGPRIHFWSYVVIILAAAYALSKTGTPLKFVDWALLGLGLSVLPAAAVWVVPLWLLLVAWRGRTTDLNPIAHGLLQLFLFGFTFVAAGCLIWAIRTGLVLEPDYVITSPLAYEDGLGFARWYIDRFSASLPSVAALSVPMWIYRLLMLGWSLWLALRLVSWAKWAFTQYAAGGLWKRFRRAPRAVQVPVNPDIPPTIPSV